VVDSATVLTRVISNNGHHDMFNSSCQNTSGVWLLADCANRPENLPNIIYFFPLTIWTILDLNASARISASYPLTFAIEGKPDSNKGVHV
jgi:hypothetical protein